MPGRDNRGQQNQRLAAERVASAWQPRPDRWFFVDYYDDLAAEFSPVWRWLDRFWVELTPPRGWTRVSYDEFGPCIHMNGGSSFAAEELARRLYAEYVLDVSTPAA